MNSVLNRNEQQGDPKFEKDCNRSDVGELPTTQDCAAQSLIVGHRALIFVWVTLLPTPI